MGRSCQKKYSYQIYFRPASYGVKEKCKDKVFVIDTDEQTNKWEQRQAKNYMSPNL
jgi:hypothetical protein